MPLHSNYRTPREICYAVQSVAKTEFDRLTARPWNMYEPETTEWWLVPSNEWPAYKYGKFFFRWGELKKNSILAGLYVEKGLAESISSAYPSAKGSRLIMGNNWKWPYLVADLGNNSFSLKIKGLAKKLPSPVELKIDGGYVPEPTSFDPYSTHFGWDRFSFEWDTTADNLNLKGSKTDAHVLEGLSHVVTVTNLWSTLDSLAANPWFWIDFFVGIRLRIIERPGDKPVWTPSDLWAQFLRHFSPWIGSGG